MDQNSTITETIAELQADIAERKYRLFVAAEFEKCLGDVHAKIKHNEYATSLWLIARVYNSDLQRHYRYEQITAEQYEHVCVAQRVTAKFYRQMTEDYRDQIDEWYETIPEQDTTLYTTLMVLSAALAHFEQSRNQFEAY